jgi:protein TonB
MKRNEDKVPGFDEIIFENRNKEYGAYDLRKRYNSVKSLSVIGAIAFCIIPVTALFLTTEKGTAEKIPEVFVIIEPDNYKPEFIKQPEVKMPPQLTMLPKNIAPVVTTDTLQDDTFIPITEVILSTIKDGDVNDTLVNVEIPIDIVPAEPEPFVAVEEMPVFPGGDAALLEFIGRNTVYPDEAIKNNIEGRVILKFVVESDGSVGRIQVLRSIDPLLDKEAKRVVGMLPRFKPGRQNGVPVPVLHSVPVLFRIENNR